MGIAEGLNFVLNELPGIAISGFIKIITNIVSFFVNIPTWLKIIIWAFIILFSIALIYNLFKDKDGWRHVR